MANKTEYENMAKDVNTNILNKPTREMEVKAQKESDHTPVVITGAKPKKKSLGSRFVKVLGGAQGMDTIGATINRDIIIPSLQNALATSAKAFIDMLIYGAPQGNYTVSAGNNGNNQRYRYDRVSVAGSTNTTARGVTSSGSRHAEVIQFTTMAQAKDCVRELEVYIQQSGWARISDLYDITGLTSQLIKPGDTEYGWQDMHQANIRFERDCYCLYLPVASYIRY